MSKTLNELAQDLKEYIYELQSDAHNIGGFNKYRYNNLKVEIADPRTTKTPQVTITVGMSEVVFNLNTKEKVKGGLGPDERYVIRWLNRDGVVNELKEILKQTKRKVSKVERKTYFN